MHEAEEGVGVNEACTPEVMDDLRLPRAGLGISLVVGEGEVGDLTAACVATSCLPEIYPAFEIMTSVQLMHVLSVLSCVYAFSALQGCSRRSIP